MKGKYRVTAAMVVLSLLDGCSSQGEVTDDEVVDFGVEYTSNVVYSPDSLTFLMKSQHLSP